jgi:hypothetical protein
LSESIGELGAFGSGKVANRSHDRQLAGKRIGPAKAVDLPPVRGTKEREDKPFARGGISRKVTFPEENGLAGSATHYDGSDRRAHYDVSSRPLHGPYRLGRSDVCCQQLTVFFGTLLDRSCKCDPEQRLFGARRWLTIFLPDSEIIGGPGALHGITRCAVCISIIEKSLKTADQPKPSPIESLAIVISRPRESQ